MKTYYADTADGDDGHKCSAAGKAWLAYTEDEDNHDYAGAIAAVEVARKERPHYAASKARGQERGNRKRAEKLEAQKALLNSLVTKRKDSGDE